MKKLLGILALGAILLGCSNQKIREYEGVYTYGHEVRIFQDSESNQEYWLYSDNDIVENLNKKIREEIETKGVTYPEVKLIIKGIDEGKATNGLAEPNDRKMKVIDYKIIEK